MLSCEQTCDEDNIVKIAKFRARENLNKKKEGKEISQGNLGYV